MSSNNYNNNINNNNRLAEFASSQVVAIADVLRMVARDRRRVQALLREAESPSLRRYLEEWLEATPASSYIDNTDKDEESTNSNDYDSAASTVEEGATKSTTKKHNSCPCGCWKKQNAAQVSFWDILETSPACVRQQYDYWIKRHNHQRGRLAYGVSYEWLTEPMSISGGHTQSSRFDWEDVDHFFQGRDISFIDHLEGNPEATSVFIQQAIIVSDSSWYRIVHIPDTVETNICLFGGEKSAFPTVQEVFSSKTKTTMEDPGELHYDIVFYAAEHDCLLRHQRTAKGSLVFTAKKRNSNNSQSNEADVHADEVLYQYRSDAFAENANSNTNHINNDHEMWNWVLQGTVRMDACMDALDVVPFGGNFTFEESTRFERVISEQAEADEWEHSSTSVVSIRVTQPPAGLTRLIAPRHDNTTSSSSSSSRQEQEEEVVGAMFGGEMRVVQKRTAARLLSRKDVMAQNDPTIGRTGFTDPDSVLSTERAQHKLEDYHDRMCLWMHRHTNLPRDVICRIGQYVSPPPIFFLERGDLVIDIDWSPTVREEGEDGRDDALDFISTSCIIAKPRRK